MLLGYSPTIQALIGTIFTWALTAAGSASVFLFNGYKRSFLDASLGFSAGVMTAASFWSLLLPALEITAQTYEDSKLLSLLPVIVGLILGALFVYLTDIFLPDNYVESMAQENKKMMRKKGDEEDVDADENEMHEIKFNYSSSQQQDDEQPAKRYNLRQRHNTENNTSNETLNISINSENVRIVNSNNNSSSRSDSFKHISSSSSSLSLLKSSKYRRILLLIIAVTVHNIPEGLAVGVGFGAIGKTKSATFESARNLALGIGIQNFPEGLAVSLPLYASGFSRWKSFWYGQLSGMVEPVAGLLGALGVGLAQSFLPYALAFAAGAMLYVVFENIIPESASQGNGKLSTWSCMIGFCIMMSLDVGLN